LVLHVEVIDRVAARGKRDRQVPADLVGLIEQKSGERISKSGSRIPISGSRTGRKGKPAARIEGLGLQQVLALPPYVEAPLDDLSALGLRPIVDEVEISH